MIPAVAAMALLASGCGSGGDDGEPATTDEPEASSTTTSPSTAPASPAPAPFPTEPPSLATSTLADTWWESDGYGYVLRFDGDLAFELFEVTPPLGAIRLLGGTVEQTGDRPAQLINADPIGLVEVGESLGALRIEADRLYFRRVGTTDEIVIHPLAGRPELLDLTPDASPAGTVAYFCEVFRTHHAFLQDRVDEVAVPSGRLAAGSTWSDHCGAAVEQVAADASRPEICAILAEVLFALGDAHTFVADPFDDSCNGGSQHPDTLATMFPGRPADNVDGGELDDRLTAAFEIVETTYLDGDVYAVANGQILYGAVADAPILYMRIRSFSDYSDDDFEDDRQGLRDGLDEIMTFAADNQLRAVVIDLRDNGGGSDSLGIEIAGRFNNADYVAYVERARNDSGDPAAFTDGQEVIVAPTGASALRDAPIVLLTARTSFSAAETFAMAMAERGPEEERVIRIGEPTQGVFSDVHIRLLPGLFAIGLPNERYETTSGIDHEIDGVPPDIEVPVFTAGDIAAGRDPALERAFEELLDADSTDG